MSAIFFTLKVLYSVVSDIFIFIMCRFDLLDVCINGPKEKLDSTVISQVLDFDLPFFFCNWRSEKLASVFRPKSLCCSVIVGTLLCNVSFFEVSS